MKISNLRKEERGTQVVLIADIDSCKKAPSIENSIWVSVPKQYENFLTLDRYDSFLAALLYPAMAHGEDIEIEGIVSEKLWYNITEYVVHILLAYSPWLKKINISATKTTDNVIDSATHIGTGFSGGIDSFCTIYDKFVLETNPKFKIDTLVNLNVGNYYGKNPDETDTLFQHAYQRLSGFPNFVGLPYIPIHSSMAYIYKEKWNFQKVHLLNTIAGVLAMQNYFNKYYFASAFAYKELSVYTNTVADFDIAGFCDVYICQFLSTETLSIIPDGHQYTRAQKTERISHYSPTYDFLEVAPKDSMGKQDILRPKSIRVLTTLDTLDKLELYSKVFDLDKYKKNRFRIRCRLVLDYKKDPFAADNIVFARLYGKKFPNYFVAILVCLTQFARRVLRSIRRRIFGRRIKK